MNKNEEPETPGCLLTGAWHPLWHPLTFYAVVTCSDLKYNTHSNGKVELNQLLGSSGWALSSSCFLHPGDFSSAIQRVAGGRGDRRGFPGEVQGGCQRGAMGLPGRSRVLQHLPSPAAVPRSSLCPQAPAWQSWRRLGRGCVRWVARSSGGPEVGAPMGGLGMAPGMVLKGLWGGSR